MTDQEIAAELGQRLRNYRTTLNLTTEEVGLSIQASRKTVSNAEKGRDVGIHIVIKLLRTYGRLDALNDFIPQPALSPMQMLRDKSLKTPRVRVRSRAKAEDKNRE